VQDFHLFVTHRVGLKRNRRLHGCQRDQLQQMIRHHVAQGPRLFVIAAALLDADLFRGRDLHTIDVAAVPNRLEDTVAETKHHDVLHGLFTEIMIDPINLLLAQHTQQISV
jgi:hypothetical protein